MTSSPAERALAHVRALFPSPGPAGLFDHAAITVNFHPDRLLTDGRTVVQHLAASGVYRSQFETGISNGGLGGPRLRWERQMFGGVYRTASGRPLYGALNLAGHPDGAAPRFGSCHLVLHPAVAQRATFSHGDSAAFPADLRGPEIPPLARSIAEHYGRDDLDAELIGRAARTAAGDPDRLQHIKYLWHILVLRGHPK